MSSSVRSDDTTTTLVWDPSNSSNPESQLPLPLRRAESQEASTSGRNWKWIVGAVVVGTIALVAAVALAALFFPPVLALLPAVIGAGTLALLGIKIGLGTTAVVGGITALAMLIMGLKGKGEDDRVLPVFVQKPSGLLSESVDSSLANAPTAAEVEALQMQGNQAPPAGAVHLTHAHEAAAAAAAAANPDS